MFVECHDVGHALLVKIGGRIRENIIREGSLVEEQEEIKGRYAGTGESSQPVPGPPKDAAVHCFTEVLVGLKNVLVEALFDPCFHSGYVRA
jgi:hypothetical protein